MPGTLLFMAADIQMKCPAWPSVIIHRQPEPTVKHVFHHDIKSFLWLFLSALSYRVDDLWKVDPEETVTPIEGPGGTLFDRTRFWETRARFEGDMPRRRFVTDHWSCTLDWVKALPNGNKTLSGPLLVAWCAHRMVFQSASLSPSSAPQPEEIDDLVDSLYWFFHAGLSSHAKSIQDLRDGKGSLVEVVEVKLEDNEHVTDEVL
ncbi:hypothetical protein VTO73DRAFT_1217 [Trametes versicolor]